MKKRTGIAMLMALTLAANLPAATTEAAVLNPTDANENYQILLEEPGWQSIDRIVVTLQLADGWQDNELNILLGAVAVFSENLPFTSYTFGLETDGSALDDDMDKNFAWRLDDNTLELEMKADGGFFQGYEADIWGSVMVQSYYGADFTVLDVECTGSSYPMDEPVVTDVTTTTVTTAKPTWTTATGDVGSTVSRPIMLGDVDSDRKLTMSDAVMMARMMTEDRQLKIALGVDFNMDGDLNIFDLNSLLKYLMTNMV